MYLCTIICTVVYIHIVLHLRWCPVQRCHVQKLYLLQNLATVKQWPLIFKKLCTVLPCSTYKRYLASLLGSGGDPTVSTPIMALIKHATHEFSRLLPLPYPCFYSAFAFRTCLPSLNSWSSRSQKLPSSIKQPSTLYLPHYLLSPLIAFFHSLRKPFFHEEYPVLPRT
jgi:hypothetical protein